MTPTRHIARLVAGLVLAAPAFAYDSLEALNKDFSARKAEAVRTYLEEHPDADDRSEAETALVVALLDGEQFEAALDVIKSRYTEKESLLEVDGRELVGEYIAPVVYLNQELERKEDALTFLDDMAEKLAEHDQADFIAGAIQDMRAMIDQVGVGDVMELSFTSLDGKDIDMEQYRGGVVLVDFWATWCVPCLRTLPGLKDLYAGYHDRGFEILGISLDEDREKLTSFLEKEEIAWPQQFDGKGWENELAASFGISAIPTTYLVGPDGVIVAKNPTKDELNAMLDELLPPETTE